MHVTVGMKKADYLLSLIALLSSYYHLAASIISGIGVQYFQKGLVCEQVFVLAQH